MVNCLNLLPDANTNCNNSPFTSLFSLSQSMNCSKCRLISHLYPGEHIFHSFMGVIWGCLVRWIHHVEYTDANWCLIFCWRYLFFFFFSLMTSSLAKTAKVNITKTLEHGDEAPRNELARKESSERKYLRRHVVYFGAVTSSWVTLASCKLCELDMCFSFFI